MKTLEDKTDYCKICEEDRGFFYVGTMGEELNKPIDLYNCLGCGNTKVYKEEVKK